MTRDEHLMTIAMEECAEVAQRISNALRFGLSEIQPGQNETNLARIYHEFWHLRAVLGMMQVDAWGSTAESRHVEGEKSAAVNTYLDYSKKCGTLTSNKPPSIAESFAKMVADFETLKQDIERLR